MTSYFRRRAVAVALVVTFFTTTRGADAQGLPGSARGSQTGDSGNTYSGLAVSPDANLFTGVAQTSIPIEVPPGRLGLAPVLALSYSSNGGPGPFGYGWDLPLPRIHRSTRLGIPRYDETDAFVLEMPGGATELEPAPGSSRGFRAKVESTFLRIGFHEGENAWTVIDKLGVTFVFGASSTTRTGRSPTTTGTFAWLLDRIEDTAGNRIEFTYRIDAGTGMSSGLPEQIRYGANSRIGTAHFADVNFLWTALARSAPAIVSWRNGYRETGDVRLSAIETSTHGLAARHYDFSHEEDRVTADLRLVGVTLTAHAANPQDDVTLPSTVFVYAPAVSGGWSATGSTNAPRGSFEIPNAGVLRIGDSNVTADSLDLNGDAIVDRIDTGFRPPQVMLGNGRGFGPLRPWNWPTASSAPKAVRRSDGKGNLLSNVFDLDGDGLADLVDSNPAACGAAAGTWCVWRGSTDGFATSPTRWAAPLPVLRATLESGAEIVSDLIDIDADGRLDVVDATSFDEAIAARYWHVHRNTGSGFATAPKRFAAPFAWLARSMGARLVCGLFDLNGDSLPDLVSADPDCSSGGVRWNGLPEWTVHLNRGDGLDPAARPWPIEAGGPSSLPNFLNLHAVDGSAIADLFDLTGDGRPDLVRRWRTNDPVAAGTADGCVPSSRCLIPAADDPATSTGLCCYNLLVYANTGSSFAQPVAWSSPAHGLRSDIDSCPFGISSLECRQSYAYDFDFFDLDGDGLVEFVERYTAGGKPGAWLVHPHPAAPASGGARPNLLLAMRNGVGGETMLRYTTAAATEDSRLPFPHWVVRERELRDSVRESPPLLTSYAYRGAAFDAADREMRGFAVVQEVDPVGVSRVREYHQDRRRAGRLRRLTSLAPAPCNPVDPNDPGDPCSPWRAPLGSSEYEWPEQGPVLLGLESDAPMHNGSPVENLRVTTRYHYDDHGNVIHRRTSTPMAADTDTQTEYKTLIRDRAGGIPVLYIAAKPSHVLTREDGRDLPLVERRFEYEGSSGLAGALSVASTCIDQTLSGCGRWSSRSFTYDSFGNEITARGPDGAVSRTDYDAEGLFAVRAVDPIGLLTTSTTDPRTGQVTETVAPNGNRLHTRHDGLGRMLRTWGPGSSEETPLLQLAYAPGGLGEGPPRALAIDAASGTSCTFSDGLGAPVATKTATTEGGRPVSLVTGLQKRNARGLVVTEALPFNSDDIDVGVLSERFDDAPAWLEHEYDAIGRRTATRAPDGTQRRNDPSAPGILRRDDANLTDGFWPGSVTLELFDGLSRRVLRDVCSAAPVPSSPYECPTGTLLRRESWTHDGLGRVVESRTSALGLAAGDAVTRIERDGLGNTVQVESSNAGTWRYRNDASGRVIETLKPDGTRITTIWDTAGRLLGRRGPAARSTYRYHSSGGGIGKLQRVSTRSRSSRSSEDLSYDDRSRVLRRHRRVAPRGYAAADLSVAYEYDNFDRRTAIRYESLTGDNVVHYDRDEQGRETRVWSDAFAFIRSSVRDSLGRLARIDYGNGLADLRSWDSPSNVGLSAGYLRCARTTTARDGSIDACSAAAGDLEARRYVRYDPNGNLIAADDIAYSPGDPRKENLRYEYDALGRLLSAGTAATGREHFAFDPLGNLLIHDDIAMEYRDAANPSRITTIRKNDGIAQPVSYDVDGRRIREGDTEYTYDDTDRLTSVMLSGAGVAEYGYLDSGERAYSKDIESSLVSFELGDGIRLDGEMLERTILFEGRPVAVERRPAARNDPAAPERVFLHADHQQSVRLTSDENGRAIEHDRYRAFGTLRLRLNGEGGRIDDATTRFGFTGHIRDDTGLLYLGARHYDPLTGAFLTLDPKMQFASPYAYSGGNPIAGRDADGAFFEWTAMQLLTIATGTAAFIDSIVRTGDLGHSLTAGVFAGFSVSLSAQLSTTIARPLMQVGHPWLQMAAAVATEGFQAVEAAEAIEDGRYAGGVMAAGMLAASLIGIETASDPGPGSSPEENYARHGITDRGVSDGKRTIDVNGICATRPGCFTNILVAAKENLRVLFGAKAACVGGCEQVAAITSESLNRGEDVALRCNSFGAIKCLGAIQDGSFAANLSSGGPAGRPRLTVEMSGAPLLRPPKIEGLTYQVNLFDPVVWVGSGYSTPLRSDVVLGRNWWVPAPLIVHHSRMYEKPFHEALGEILP